MEIKLSVIGTLKILNEHRANHIKEYEKQIQGWKIAMDKWQIEMDTWKKAVLSDAVLDTGDQDKNRPQEPFKPKNYIETYDKYIDMLMHHVEEIIEVDEREFEMIINDEFGWRTSFMAASNTYSKL